MIKRFPTDCCALCQLTMGNEDSLENIQNAVSVLKKQSKEKDYWKTNKLFGQRAAFVITTPNERLLEINLRKAGFKRVFKFERRNGYDAGILKMWCINI